MRTNMTLLPTHVLFGVRFREHVSRRNPDTSITLHLVSVTRDGRDGRPLRRDVVVVVVGGERGSGQTRTRLQRRYEEGVCTPCVVCVCVCVCV